MGRAQGKTAHAVAAARRGAGGELSERERILEGVRRMGFHAAYEVGGCVRDELMGRDPKDIDIAIAGHTQDDLLARAKAEGRALPLLVAGQLVGVRMKTGWTPPEGIELALARTEESTGAGRHDFAIKADADVDITADLARRDFTCNAIARDIYTGELIDPYNGAQDIANGVLRTVSDQAFPEDPLRVVRGLARCAKDGSMPDERTRAQMAEWAADPKRYLRASAADIIADRDTTLAAQLTALTEKAATTGEAKDAARADAARRTYNEFVRVLADADALDVHGNVDRDRVHDWVQTAADEQGATRKFFEDHVTGYRWYGDVPLSPERMYEEVTKTLSGAHAGQAMTLARDVGALGHLVPELADSVGFDQRSPYHDLTVDEHTLRVLDHACELDAPMPVRWAALLHDAGKPAAAWSFPEGHERYDGGERLFYFKEKDLGYPSHEDVGAEMVDSVFDRFAADNETRKAVKALVTHHMFTEDEAFEQLKPRKQAIRARRFLADHGRERAQDLLTLRRCDRAGKHAQRKPGWDRETAIFEEGVRSQLDQPVDKRDLAITGHDLMAAGLKGPDIGLVRDALVARVVVDPHHNNPERLKNWAADFAERLAAGKDIGV